MLKINGPITFYQNSLKKLKTLYFRVPLLPYFFLSRYAMHNADSLLSMSDSCPKNWAQKFSKRRDSKSDFVLYLFSSSNEKYQIQI